VSSISHGAQLSHFASTKLPRVESAAQNAFADSVQDEVAPVR